MTPLTHKELRELCNLPVVRGGCGKFQKACIKLLDENERLRGALPDPLKLEVLAQWFDEHDARIGRVNQSEVQNDLRKWAQQARTLLEEEDDER